MLMISHYTPIPIIDRMGLILDILDVSPAGLQPAQLRKALDIPKTTLYRLLSAMVENGFLTYNPTTNAYTLGSRFWATYTALDERCQKLREVSAVYLSNLVRQAQETVKLNVRSGFHSYTALSLEGNKPIRISVNPGAVFPLHTGAGGKILMCSFTRDEIFRYYTLHGTQYTEKTIMTPEALIEELDLIRSRGYALDLGEYLADIRAVACPIMDNEGQILASVSVVYPVVSEDNLDIEVLARQIQETTRAISTALYTNVNSEKLARIVIEGTDASGPNSVRD